MSFRLENNNPQHAHLTIDTKFDSGLPYPPPYSPLILSPRMFEPQWDHQDSSPLLHLGTGISPILSHAGAVKLVGGFQISTEELSVTIDSASDIISLGSDTDFVMERFNLPPLHHVNAFHAHACIIEAPAPAMQRGLSHRVEILSTMSGDSGCNAPIDLSSDLTIDLDFASFSSLFPLQPHSDILSPSWQLELTLSPSWHLAAESAASLSQPDAPGSDLVRRPATRRRSVAADLGVPIRNSPHLNGKRDSIYSNNRLFTDSAILKLQGPMDSPVLKSRGYRVRFAV
ncbi:hypothetical protein K439DRAFT_1621089 [Ramaria rubella]|nr:hypothetical protein K439DRAFT_1621089 [Ramaria rubella]